MLSRKKRDAKFLIFQSLYIIAIAILFYKGTDLALNPVQEVNETDTVIAKNLIPDSSETNVKKITLDSLKKNNRFVDSYETVVAKDTLEKMGKRIEELVAQKTPPREEKKKEEVQVDKTPQNPVKGGREK